MKPMNTTPSHKDSPAKQARDSRDYERRLKAAGLDNDTIPDDDDAFRFELARRITMFFNEWHGHCPEPLCQRNRGCMAPNNFCANVRQPSPEELWREWPSARAEVYTAVQEHLAAHGVDKE
jgi:hypothetical protein